MSSGIQAGAYTPDLYSCAANAIFHESLVEIAEEVGYPLDISQVEVRISSMTLTPQRHSQGWKGIIAYELDTRGGSVQDANARINRRLDELQDAAGPLKTSVELRRYLREVKSAVDECAHKYRFYFRDQMTWTYADRLR